MRRRRFLFLLVALLATGVLLVALLPWWLGVALHALPEKWGMHYARYERLGYSRFALHDVEYRRGSVRVTATRVESDSPVVWLLQRWRGRPREIVAEKWSVVVEPKPANVPPSSPPTPNRIDGWIPLRALLGRVADKLAQWLPRAKVGPGRVAWPGGGLTLASAAWENRTLDVKGLAFRALHADATVAFPAGADELRFGAKTLDGAGAVTLKNTGGDAAGEVTWWGQHATLKGRFGDKGWLPAQATLQADALDLPGAKLKLGDAYAVVRGHGRIDWSEQGFQADIALKGEPTAGKKSPPLETTLRGHGDLKSFTVEALHATLPGIVADLSAPATVDRQGRFAESAAKFTVQADLAKQPWFDAKGSLTGEAQLVAGVAQAPIIEFHAQARDVAAQGIALAGAEANGKLAWPKLELSSASVTGAGGERLVAQGGWDFRAKEFLATRIEGEIHRATLSRWLPAQPQFATIALKAEMAGPLAAARYSGEAKAAGVSFAGVKPLALTATWRGQGATIEEWHAEASASATQLTLAGAANRDGVKLTAAELTQNHEPRLKLTQPAAISWRPTLQVVGLRLAGAESELNADVTWGAAGSAAIAIRNVPSTWLADLVALPGPAWQVSSVALTGSWDRGPMTFSAVLGAAIELSEGRRAQVNLSGRGDKGGVRLEALRAAEGAASIVNASGTIPLTLTPGAKPLLHIDERAPLQIDADTAPNAAFWQELAALTGLELQEPHAAVHVKGSWLRPEGEVRLNVARVAADAKRFKRPLPTIEALNVGVTGDRAGLRLDALTLRVEGQEVKASGRLPIPEADWEQAWKQPLAFARRGADVRFEIPDAEVAVFSRFLPLYLAPKGRLHVDVNYKAGALGGSLSLHGAATRPLGPLGVLQDIEADVRLAGNTVEVRSINARSGGEDVTLTGKLELPEFKPGEPLPLPKFDVALQGKNLPFVRRSGLLLRGDLDLKLTTPDRGAPRLSGNVKLRDSLFLQDVRAFRPSGAHSVARRPPYFSIDTPPLNTWRLDVNVEGNEFLRLRTTLFSGTASAKFHLGGTLAEPVAIGEATVKEGKVRLPFASFDVQDGRAVLTREQPYEPQLAITATARRFSYDLRLEITGTATTPVLAFSSSPPLEHGQILLMVMTGEAPKTDTEVTLSDQQRAQRVGAFLGQSLLASLGETESAERLSITTGDKLSRQGRDTYEVEYKLADRWSIVGEYDEFDDINAGVKWRAYTKGGREDTEARKKNATDQR